MELEKKYSDEWNNLVNSAILYQNNLRDFLSIRNDILQHDLKQALHDKTLEYYAIKTIEYMSDKMQINFLEDLFYVVICGNISNAYLAKQIIVKLKNYPSFKDQIIEFSERFTLEMGPNDIYVVKDIAMLLYELKYKDYLLKYIDNNIDALKESEFIESYNDLLNIKNMDG